MAKKKRTCVVVMVNDYPYCALEGNDPSALEAVTESARTWVHASGWRLPEDRIEGRLIPLAHVHTMEVPLHGKTYRFKIGEKKS